MTTDRITYKQLDEVLTHLGFSRRRVDDKWLRYEHAPSKSVIVVAEKKSNEFLRVTDAVSARRHLVEKGLIEEEQLDEVLSGSVTASKSSTTRKS